jgi:hypothetical protein
MNCLKRCLLFCWIAMLLMGQKPPPKVEQTVFQAALQHPPLAPYLNPAAASDQGLCILNNGVLPAHYKLTQFGRPLVQRSEAVLLEYQHFHYLIFTHASQWGDSARVEFQARLSRVEVLLDLKKQEKDWQVQRMQLFQLP